MLFRPRFAAALAFAGCLLGLIFAAYSTLDYANHLDRQVHNLHCSLIPGAAATAEADTCRAALYSPYAAVLKESFWGGVPISLFGLGAFAFLAGFALYLWVGGEQSSRKSVWFFAFAGSTPLIVSLVMLTISVTELGSICQTCAGIYVSSLLSAAGAVLLLVVRKGAPSFELAAWPLPVVWLVGLGAVTLLPASVYAMAMPDHRPYLKGCGALKQLKEPHQALIRIATTHPKQPVISFEDPLCPTCKALHDRLVNEGLYERLAPEVVLLPLEASCNWMLDRDLHPGACMVSRALLCAHRKSPEEARKMLDWAYHEQEYLTRAGKAGEGTMRAVIQERWGADLVACVDSKEAAQKLNYHLHFAVDNGVALSTPQLYLGGERFCDEDTDIGLRFALRQRAPQLFE